MATENFLFSIVIVSNTIGADLDNTIDSVLQQKFTKFELIIKCNDQEISKVASKYSSIKNIKFISQADIGIYDAMNQAIDHCVGEFTFFLNVGDEFYDVHSLNYLQSNSSLKADILYSPYIYRDCIVEYPKKLSRAFFFRNALCHQSYFIRTSILQEYRFNLVYMVLADHDLLLKVQQASSVTFEKIDRPLSKLELMGFSAKNESVKISERKALEREYYSLFEVTFFSILSIISMRGLRNYLLQYNMFFNIYNRIKTIYFK